MFTSHCREEHIAVSVGTALVAKLLFGKFMLDKTTLNQLSMWTYGAFPEPIVLKVHDGGPFWTSIQVIQMYLLKLGETYISRLKSKDKQKPGSSVWTVW